jgi:hypothetical protein
MIRGLWTLTAQGGKALPNFYLFSAPIPSGDTTIHIELRTHRRLAQVVNGNEKFWEPPPLAPASIHLPGGTGDSLTEQGIDYFHGRKIWHMYLIAIVQALYAYNDLNAAVTDQGAVQP